MSSPTGDGYHGATPSRLSALTLSSQGTDTTNVSAHAVSHYEKITYYNGITHEGEHPDLLYRTRSDKYPWTKPTGRNVHQPTKSLCGVHGTRLTKSGALSVPKFAGW